MHYKHRTKTLKIQKTEYLQKQRINRKLEKKPEY